MPDGPLYALDSSDRLLTIKDPRTREGSSSVIGTIGDSLEGLKFNASGTLFGFNSNDLYTVNTANGQATLVGAFSGIAGSPFRLRKPALNEKHDVRLGRQRSRARYSNLYTVDTGTGVASLIGDIGYTPRALDYQDGTLYGFALGNPAVVQHHSCDTTTGSGTFVVEGPVPAESITAPPAHQQCRTRTRLVMSTLFFWALPARAAPSLA